MQLSTAQMIAIMVAIVVIMSRVFSSIYVGFYGLLSAKLIVILHLAKTFSEKNRPNSCAFQSYCITLPSLQFIDADSPHNLRARIYVQARPTFLIGCGLIFFAHNLPHLHGVRPLFMRSTPHSVEMQIDRIRRFAFHVFLLPFVAEKH